MCNTAMDGAEFFARAGLVEHVKCFDEG